MTDEELMTAALASQGRAYAPYSKFRVGAAVLAGDRVYGGANVENASYGLTLCAERSAVARAIFDGARALDVVAIATDASPPAPPCGMCLQSIAEFSPDFSKTRVLLGNAEGVRRAYTLAELLPHGFQPSDLGTGQKKDE